MIQKQQFLKQISRCATFLPILKATNLFIALIPYFVISVALYVFLLMLLGSVEDDEDGGDVDESEPISLTNYSTYSD